MARTYDGKFEEFLRGGAAPGRATGNSAAETARRLARLRRIAWLMDGAFRLPGGRFRFGLNSIIGLPPGVGDAALAAISLYIVYEAWQLGIPGLAITRMLGNIAIETAIGSIPIAGDLFDVAFKANLRNMDIIDRHVRSGA
nr:DUF4112 domain-containing protein [uncultured Lichenicoccus sp.]